MEWLRPLPAVRTTHLDEHVVVFACWMIMNPNVPPPLSFVDLRVAPIVEAIVKLLQGILNGIRHLLPMLLQLASSSKVSPVVLALGVELVLVKLRVNHIFS